MACAFCDEADIDAVKSLTRRYGGGAYKYCGALMGAVAAMNYRDGALDPENPADMEGKNAVAAAKLLESFRAKNGSVYCRELKGRDTGVVLRTSIEIIDRFFSTDEVQEIWLTFSDPQMKNPRKRLTSTYFMERYRHFLVDGGVVHLKTDSNLSIRFEIPEDS